MRRALRLLVLVAVALIVTTASSPKVCADYPYPVEYIGKYYSDDTYTTVIGGRVVDCCGESVFWGRYSHYQIWEEGPCGECFPPTGW